MFDHFFFIYSSKSTPKPQNDRQKTLLIIKDDDYAAAGDDEFHNPTAAMALVLTSWLNGRRLRYLILALCLPLLVPILCVSFPVLCAVEVCFRICRRRRSRRRLKSAPSTDVEGGGPVVVVELNLLERYLNDQLELALEFVCECDETDDLSSYRTNLLC